VRKVNIDTDIRLAMTAAVRKFLATKPQRVRPRDYLKPAREAAKQICKARYEQFGCAGMASKVKPIALDAGGEPLQVGRVEADRKLSRRGADLRRCSGWAGRAAPTPEAPPRYEVLPTAPGVGCR